MEELINKINEMAERQERIEEKLTRLLEKGEPLKEVMDTQECARYIGVSVGRLRTLTASHQIPFFKHELGKRNYYRRTDIDNWKASRRVKTDRELQIEAATAAALARRN